MKNKKKLVFMVIGAITLIAVTLGATYAYFVAQSGGDANLNINAGTGTTDNLSFEVGESINIFATEENFAQGMGNQTDSTYAKALLTANNTTNTATRNYNIYLDVTTNEFQYTTENETAELILTVTDPKGVEVTNIDGLKHVTVGEVSGFDITTIKGLITIADNYEITATPQAQQEWDIRVTFVNLDSDQSTNSGKELTAELIIQEAEKNGSIIQEPTTPEWEGEEGGIVETVVTPSENPTGEEDETKYFTIYTVGYITSTKTTGSTYTINIAELGIDLSKYTLELVSSSVMTTQEDYNNYLEMKANGTPATSMVGANSEKSAIATAEELYKYSLTAEELTIDNISVSCTEEICQATIKETFNVSDSREFHKTVAVDGTELNTLYTGKKFVIRTKEKLSLASVCPDGGNFAECIETFYDNYGEGTEGLYYHDGNGESGICKYNDIAVFSSLKLLNINNNHGDLLADSEKDCQNIYVIYTAGTPIYMDDIAEYLISDVSDVYWDSSDNTCRAQTTKEKVYDLLFRWAIKEENCSGTATKVQDKYYLGLTKIGIGNYSVTKNQEAEDNSYRYSGANPNNYVCFGSDEATCPDDNLYRIIGVFGSKVKLIKATSYGNYVWDSGNSNTWDVSTKPDIYTTLNTTYYNTLGSEWQNLIAESTWQVGGVTELETPTAKGYYDLEVGKNTSNITDLMKVGLPYISDSIYSSKPYFWNVNELSVLQIGSYNWIYEPYGWYITHNVASNNEVFTMSYDAFINSKAQLVPRLKNASSTGSVLPTFYLKSDVEFISGTGTQTDPYRLAV